MVSPIQPPIGSMAALRACKRAGPTAASWEAMQKLFDEEWTDSTAKQSGSVGLEVVETVFAKERAPLTFFLIESLAIERASRLTR